MKTKAVFHNPFLQTGPAEKKVVENQNCESEMTMSAASALRAERLVGTFYYVC